MTHGPEHAPETSPKAAATDHDQSVDAQPVTETSTDAAPAQPEPVAAETAPTEAAESQSPPPVVVEMQTPAESSPTTVATETAETAVTEEAGADAKEVSASDAAVAANLTAPSTTELKKGQRLDVKLVQIGETDCFVDYGGRSEGMISTLELKADPKAEELQFKEGDKFQVVVKSASDPVVFTLGRRPMSPGLIEIKKAFESKLPVQGTVKATNKGGFEISLAGGRAFCPFSQIELGYCDKPEQYVGQKLPFRVMTFERNGKNIVLSRRPLLEADAKEAAVATRERLAVGEVFPGVVRRLQPYGAFIDIGGIDGLVHVSEIRHGHVGDPKDVLKVGESVQVKVLKIDGLGSNKERVSLSMKGLEPDPWTTIETELAAGTVVKGKVVRLTEFGAFIELQPGVDGLVHISELAEGRVETPQDVVSVGQEVDARVLAVDAKSQRISLSLRAEGSSPAPRRPRSDRRPERESTPMNYRSESESEVKKGPDVSGMDYDDALELLRKKFKGN